MWLTKAHTSQEAPTSISGSSSLNAFAILFPYLRSVITDITKASLIPIVLPTINIQNLLEKKIEYLELEHNKYRELI